MEVNYELMYRKRCEELNSRINSAVMARLSIANHKPLTVIDLSENYVGSRGVLPILDMLRTNHTVESINLSHNGLDNNAVRELVKVARHHKGLRIIDVGHNNCTQAIGKDLIHLVENNHNIIDLKIAGNDVYDALIKRITISLNQNREIQGNLPQLVPTLIRPTPPPMGGPAVRITSQNGDDPQGSPRPSDGVIPEGIPHTDVVQHQSGSVAPHKIKPRPAPPNAASQGYRRMTPQERQEARQNYQRRLLNQCDQLSGFLKGASELPASSKARKRLEELQREQAVKDGKIINRGNQEEEIKAIQQEKKLAISKRVSAVFEEEEAATSVQTGCFGNAQDMDRPELAHMSEEALAILSKQDQKIAAAEKELNDAEHERECVNKIQDERERLIQNMETSPTAGDIVKTEQPDTQQDTSTNDNMPATESGTLPAEKVGEPEDQQEPTKHNKNVMSGSDRLAMLLSDDEAADRRESLGEAVEPEAVHLRMPDGLDPQGVQFYELFNKGSDSYNAGEMEDAYQKWTLALDVATDCKNREWISIINGNIQALSYQLLTCQGEEHLSKGDLNDALHCLHLARDVALKARNHAWECGAETSMNTVRRAQFKVCYEAASNVFDPLISDIEDTTVDDISSGDSNFSKEWNRALKLKEALERWSEALKFGSQVSGRGSKDLLDMINISVKCALDYQITISCSPASDMRPRHSAQNTHEYELLEREQLIKLWEDVQITLRSLECPQWDAVVLSILGNLHHALFHNKQAEQCFQRSVEIAASNNFSLIEASSLTHQARVLVGLASYAEAERLLWSAETLWVKLRKVKSQKHRIYIMQHLYTCHDLLQQIMVATYRYREGLEMAERMRANTHIDKLQDKMCANFNVKTTADHMLSLARSCQSVLVIYSTVVKFDWNVDRGEAEAFEQLYIWVMPTEGEIKFSLIDVTKGYTQQSLEVIIDNLRSSLCIDSDSERRLAGKPLSNGVIVDSPEYAWRHPLQQLYDFLIYPILDFLTVNAGLEFAPHRKVTFVPHGVLHLVPWASLMDQSGRFLVEDFNIQVSASVQVLALAMLNATKLKGQESHKLTVVGGDVERKEGIDLPFPFEDPVADESEMIAEGLGCPVSSGGADVILNAMNGARLVHVGGEVLSDYSEGVSWGGFISKGCIIGAKTVETSELAAELVVTPCSNHSKRALLRGGDGVIGLCRAFICAGTPTVIYSLWNTPHQSHASLLLKFYDNLRVQPDKAICLSQAQRDMAQHDPYGPASWVCFY